MRPILQTEKKKQTKKQDKSWSLITMLNSGLTNSEGGPHSGFAVRFHYSEGNISFLITTEGKIIILKPLSNF